MSLTAPAEHQVYEPGAIRDEHGIPSVFFLIRGWEIKKLYARSNALLIGQHKILKLQVADGLQWAILWDVHRQAHADLSRGLTRFRLEWYWPGMISDVWQLIQSCKAYLAAKKQHYNTTVTDGRQKLYRGQSWQTVTVV